MGKNMIRIELTTGEFNTVGSHMVDVSKLKSDLKLEGYRFVSLSPWGYLVIDEGESKLTAYQARTEGEGCTNDYWGDLPGGYEFVGSA